MVDLTPFKVRIDRAIQTSSTDPRGSFLKLLTSMGFNAPGQLVIGRIDRIDSPEDKRGKKSGWYVYNEFQSTNGYDVIGVGSYGCWKSGGELDGTWTSISDTQMSSEDRARFYESREKVNQQKKIEELERFNDAAKKAAYIFSVSDDCKEHPYLTRKKVKPVPGLKVSSSGRLIVPVMIDECIASMQFIDECGDKKNLTGGKRKGGYFRIDGVGDDVYIAEGPSTGMSVHEATGATVYISFGSGNIYEVANLAKSKENKRIIIAGDDNVGAKVNTGRLKAEQAAIGLGCDVIFPQGFVDFNDMHCELGLDALSSYLKGSKPEIKQDNKKPEEIAIQPPTGIISDIFAYYNVTSGNKQHGFAIQTALALCSVVIGRNYRTNFDNFASLYLLNVGKSGTGKEHSKTVIERILHESGKGALISGDGYTSAGAVFSALLDKPKHISVIDEFGRYLESGANMAKGNQNQREANTKLMESIGRAHSIMRPPTYSSMTLKKDQADAIKNRVVYNPAITLLTMTTPSTLFKTLDMGAIKDGFVNRFIISISDAEREIRKHKSPVAVPERIIEWIARIDDRHGKPSLATEPASAITLQFSDDAIKLQEEFQSYCIKSANALEKFGMEELTGRSNEMAMRVALILALSRDPMAEIISADDMDWSIKYIKSLLEKTISALKMTISGSEFEAAKKEILADLRLRGSEGITWSSMQKNSPYSKYKQKDLREYLLSLKDGDMAYDEAHIGEKGGRPTTRWIAI